MKDESDNAAWCGIPVKAVQGMGPDHVVLARPVPHDAPKGWGYLATYMDRGMWRPAGMQVYDSADEALEFALKHHPHADEWDATPFRPGLWGRSVVADEPKEDE